METEQELPAASVAAQLVVRVNAAAFAPVSTTAIPLSVAVPLFIKVTVCAAAVVPAAVPGKVTDATESDAAETGKAVPVPLSAID